MVVPCFEVDGADLDILCVVTGICADTEPLRSRPAFTCPMDDDDEAVAGAAVSCVVDVDGVSEKVDLQFEADAG